jgi:hypothetical protein
MDRRFIGGVQHDRKKAAPIRPRAQRPCDEAREETSVALMDAWRISGSREHGKAALEAGRAEVTIATLILSLLFPAQPAPKPPQGYLDCAFDARNVYVCRPEGQKK